MLEEMSPAQLREWQEFAELEPFGGPHEDLRFGLVCTLLANAWSVKGGYAPGDFFPTLRETGRRQTAEEQILAAKHFTVAAGGKVVTGARG